jgi:hypothetical protein
MTRRFDGRIRLAVAFIQLVAAVFIPVAEARHAAANVAQLASHQVAIASPASRRITPPDDGCTLCEYLASHLGEAVVLVRVAVPRDTAPESTVAVVGRYSGPVTSAHHPRAPPERA